MQRKLETRQMYSLRVLPCWAFQEEFLERFLFFVVYVHSPFFNVTSTVPCTHSKNGERSLLEKKVSKKVKEVREMSSLACQRGMNSLQKLKNIFNFPHKTLHEMMGHLLQDSLWTGLSKTSA